MRSFWQTFRCALRRVFPRCITQSQAVAFNMFLAFFPMLLIALGVLASSVGLRSAVREISLRLSYILPPGTEILITRFLEQHGAHPVRWALAGLAGTLLAGTQAMRLTIDGFSMAHGDTRELTLRERTVRALWLVLATIVPFQFVVVITVFGKQIRSWMLIHWHAPTLVRGFWFTLYVVLGLVLITLVLAVVYRVGHAGARRFREAIPGAVVATLLWWAANAALGFYVRHMPYSLVYGGLAGAIGLMIWMQVTATIVFIGAAFNAERLARRGIALPD
jgi:membrane protein